MPEESMSCEITVASVIELGLIGGHVYSPSARCFTPLLGGLMGHGQEEEVSF